VSRMPPSRANALRVFLQKSMWTEIGHNFKRAHKDSRARKQLFSLALLLLLPVVAIAYLALVIGSGAWLLIPFIIPLMWWWTRSATMESAPLHIIQQPASLIAEAREDEQRALRRYFAELALIYAVLLDRSGSERYLKQQDLPEDMEVTSRRVHLNLLKQDALWDRMAQADRAAIMLPDGHWTQESINRITTGIEPLRLLRWIVRLDFRLPVVGQQLYGDLSIAHELVVDPDRILNGSDLADIEVLRDGRDQANLCQVRCVAEAISRGYAEAADEPTAKWANELSERLKGQQDEDLVLGDKLVSESSRDQLTWAAALATIRCGFLNEAIAVMERGHPPAAPMASIFAAGS
jgi:hypothetical protein